MLTLRWDDDKSNLVLIDQRKLPGQLTYYICSDVDSTAFAIKEMVVRGAPAIGATAAFGIALAAIDTVKKGKKNIKVEIEDARSILFKTRPTAVNLKWALNRMMNEVNAYQGDENELPDHLLRIARTIAEEDIQINKRMAEFGESLINDGDSIIHHCNTGSLAAVDWGTALGVIRMSHERGKNLKVFVDETRPRLQGARLTAWELEQYGIPYEIIVDGSSGYFLRDGQVNKVFFGADRVAANGDVANKIGTYMLSLAACTNNVPVYCVAPASTFDTSIKSGNDIPIEERDESEVFGITFNDSPAFPKGAKARNPAFDITPNQYITAFVTDRGIIKPPFEKNIKNVID